MIRSPPLRFLLAAIGGWFCVRAALLAPGWVSEAPGLIAGPISSQSPRAGPISASPLVEAPMVRVRDRQHLVAPAAVGFEYVRAALVSAAPELAVERVVAVGESPAELTEPFRPALSYASPVSLIPIRARTGRLSGSAWLFVRDGGGADFIPGGALGGSQAGARFNYRINADEARPLSLSARIYAPIDRPAGAEAAFGVDWKPVANLPVHLLVERRQALGREGRSAFSATLYGGVSEVAAGPLRLDAYAQAGVVGAKSRDLFADGSARLGLPVGRARIGAGAWAAAQPHVARLDVGPQASLHVPVAGTNVVVAADWRFRIAGDAVPSSGPTLTLATDFYRPMLPRRRLSR